MDGRQQEDREVERIRQRISTLTNLKLSEVYSSTREAGQALSQVTDLTVISAIQKIRRYRSGYFSYHLDPTGRGVSKRESELQKKRLAAFYQLLGCEENDELIGLVKGLFPLFEYPPGGEIPCSVNVTFESKDMYLKPEQLSHLERLAYLYARNNE